jgi:hypothetical protein
VIDSSLFFVCEIRIEFSTRVSSDFGYVDFLSTRFWGVSWFMIMNLYEGVHKSEN